MGINFSWMGIVCCKGQNPGKSSYWGVVMAEKNTLVCVVVHTHTQSSTMCLLVKKNQLNKMIKFGRFYCGRGCGGELCGILRLWSHPCHAGSQASCACAAGTIPLILSHYSCSLTDNPVTLCVSSGTAPALGNLLFCFGFRWESQSPGSPVFSSGTFNKSCAGVTRTEQQEVGFLVLFAVMLLLFIIPVNLVCVL